MGNRAFCSCQSWRHSPYPSSRQRCFSQDSCHSLLKFYVTCLVPSSGTLSGFNMTAPIGSQFLIPFGQRIGFISFAASKTRFRLAKISLSCIACLFPGETKLVTVHREGIDNEFNVLI